jgi:hypothetical protein
MGNQPQDAPSEILAGVLRVNIRKIEKPSARAVRSRKYGRRRLIAAFKIQAQAVDDQLQPPQSINWVGTGLGLPLRPPLRSGLAHAALKPASRALRMTKMRMWSLP